MKLGKLFSKVIDLGNKAKEHDSAIMTALSIGGSVVAVISAFRNAAKAKEILADEEMESREKLKRLAPLLAPVVVGETVSAVSTVGLYKKSQKLGKLLSAAVSTGSAMATLLKETEEKTNEIVGKEKGDEIRKAAQEGAAKTSSTTIDNGDGNVLFRNGSSGLMVRTTKQSIEAAFKEAQLFAAQERAKSMGYFPENSFVTIGDLDWLLTNKNEAYIVPSAHDMLGYPIGELGRDGKIDYYLSPFEYEDPGTRQTELAYNIVITTKPANVPDNATRMSRF